MTVEMTVERIYKTVVGRDVCYPFWIAVFYYNFAGIPCHFLSIYKIDHELDAS